MNIRPKTVRRVAILLGLCVLIAVAGMSVLYYSNRSKARQEQAARAAGLDAFKNENYSAALDDLHAYVGKHPDDFDAMYALAVSRSRVETSNGRHLVEAKTYFEQLHAERPDDMEVSHHLLQVYQQIGYFSEAQRVAEEVLTRDPKDIEALRTKTAALARDGKYNDALAVAQKLNDAAPLDLDGQIQTLELYQTMKSPTADVVAHYTSLQQSHADDPRFEMLLGLAYLNAQDSTNGLKWLRSAAKRTPPDAAFVERLSQCLDNLKLFSESRDLLERAATNGDHPDIVKILIERLWQNGQFQDVVDRLAKLDPNSDTSDPDLLAFKALSLYQLDKSQDCDAIVIALQNRKGSGKAKAWAMALLARHDTSQTPRKAIEQYEQALSIDRDNAVIRCWMGESYMQLGEVDLAMQQWAQAFREMPSWAHPGVLLARAELKRGQTNRALEHAVDALNRARNLVEPAVIVAQASYQRLDQSFNDADAQKLIAFIQEIQRGAPGEPETLPILAELQARTDHRDDAIATIRSAIANADNAKNSNLLMSLADVSRRQSLGIESEIFAKLPADAAANPGIALQRAMDLARAGKKDEGFKLLTDTAQPNAQWKVAQAEYLEATDDPRAKSAWVALGDDNPNNIAVQNLILNEARSAISDRDFFSRTIKRVQDLTGDDSLGWKFARAKFLLTSDDKHRDSAEAVSILRTLVGEAPDTPEYREYLAAGLINNGDIKSAIDHLKAAVERDNAGIKPMIDLIKLLVKENRVDEARTYLDRAVHSTNLTPATRQSLAVLLAQQGQIPQAIAMLDPVADSLNPDGQLVYAELLRTRGDRSAEAIYVKLLADPAVSSAAIASAADFYASTNRLDDAKKALDKLNDSRFSAIDRNMILARFDELYVSKDDARDLLVATADQAPTDENAWRTLVEFYIRTNQFDAATSAADKALANIPNDKRIASLKSQAKALAAAQTNPNDLRPLIEALGDDPENAPQVELLKAIQDEKDTKQSPQQVIAKLKTVADKYPNYWPLQQRLVQKYLEVNQPANAAIAAERLMNARPNDAGAAKLAVGVYQSAQRWRDAKRAAEQWRQRTLEKPLDADIAIAEADLALNDTQAASDCLAPYMQRVQEHPQQSPPLTAVVARLFIATDKLPQARALLQPLLSEGPTWRRLWLSLGASQVSPITAATEWLRTGAAAVSDTAYNEQFVVATSWNEIARRLNDKDATAAAIELLKTLVDHPELGPQPLMLLASLDSDAGDFASAEDLYRRALKIDANLPDALNNLSYIILKRNGDLNEAKDLATRAISLAPTIAAFHDTLARINEKLNNRDQAQAEFVEALRLDPASLDAHIGLCRSLNTAGKRDKAQQELQRIDTQLNGSTPPSESTRRELQDLREALLSSSPTE
jgi:predicted Zn-dependent protease